MHYVKFQNSDTKVYPGKILCVGRNYAAHAHELGNEVPEFPIVFLKASSVLIRSGEKITYPSNSSEMHHEVELVLMIGKTLKDADTEEAEEAITAYGVGLDMTLRDIQSESKKKGHPWTLAKNFDGAAVVSDFISKQNCPLRGNESIELKVNEILKQNSSIDHMIFSPSRIVQYLSEKMTLEEGDLIFTGTPEGVGNVSRGDRLYAKIGNVGELYTEII